MRRTLSLLVLLLAVASRTPAAGTDAGYDVWGGWRGVTTGATGRFRVARLDGVWWLVTPDGHGFFSLGVDHLTPAGDFSPPLGTSPYRDAILARYGSEAGWATATRTRLAAWGVNTIGAFSRPELFPGTIAYTVTLTLAAGAPAVPGVPPPVVARVTRDYFHPDFEAGVAIAVAERAAPCAADPWCIGVFTENELGLNQSLAQTLPYLDAYLLLPAGAPGKLAVQAFLSARYGDVASLDAAWGTTLSRFDDVQTLAALAPAPAIPPAAPTGTTEQIAARRAFDALVAARFHRVTHDALRALSPDLLILGSRLLVLSTRPEVVAAIAPWVDVVTVNYYEIAPEILALVPSYPADYGIPFARMFDDLDTIHRIAGRPILIGEFGYRAADAGLPNTLPPFFPTLATQADRAHAVGTYLRRVLARPFVVGAHWFQYMDQPATGRFDGENQNFGLVTIADDPWPAVTERLTRVAGDAAPRRVLVPGEPGGSGLDCLLEWGATAPPTAPRRAIRLPHPRFTCVDGDPACDTDRVAGQCTVEIQPCAAVADERLGACVPTAPAVVRVAQPTARTDGALQAALAASVGALEATAGAQAVACGAAVPITLPLGTRERARRRIRTLASAATGDVDRDTVHLVCERAAP